MTVALSNSRNVIAAAIFCTFLSLPIQAERHPLFSATKLLHEGLQEAESSRRSLLMPSERGVVRAQSIARALIEFQRLAEPKFQSRPSIFRFVLSEVGLLRRMKVTTG